MNNKWLKIRIGVVAAMAICLVANLQAEGIPLGQILGTAKKIGDIVVGETTVTPSYALYQYERREVWEVTETNQIKWLDNTKSSAKRSMVTGNYLYHFTKVSRRPWTEQTTVTSSTAPFELSLLARMRVSYIEVPGPENLFVGVKVKDLGNFSLAVWISSIKHTGLWPPKSGPFETYVKMSTSNIRDFGGGIWTRGNRRGIFRTQFDPMDTGYVTGAPGWVGYFYDWPGLCWVGEFYEY